MKNSWLTLQKSNHYLKSQSIYWESSTVINYVLNKVKQILYISQYSLNTITHLICIGVYSTDIFFQISRISLSMLTLTGLEQKSCYLGVVNCTFRMHCSLLFILLQEIGFFCNISEGKIFLHNSVRVEY